MEQKTVYFGENGIIKSAFHKNKNPFEINKVSIKKITLSDKKTYSKDLLKFFLAGRRHDKFNDILLRVELTVRGKVLFLISLKS